jgi:predicted ArsR family transcriptional regulator
MARHPLEPMLEVVSALREPTRRTLYDYVERQPRAVSRDEAAQAVGVSRALAAFHLDKLVRVGLLKAEYRRLSGRSGPGAGRTSKLYRRSAHKYQMSLPYRNHELLARLLADSFGSDQPSSPDLGTAREFGRSLGARARRGVQGRPADDRLIKCVVDVLETLGFEPYRASSGSLRLRNCPFDPLSRLFTPVVCGVGQAVVSGVVQGVEAPLRVAREERPDRCCGVLSSIGDGLPPACGRSAQRREMR